MKSIYASGVIYDNLHGKWARSSVILQRVMELEEKNRRNSRTSCHCLRDEAVNVEMASVYSTHAERADMDLKSEGQVWISKGRGLMLRQEEDVDPGDRVKNHHSTRYEYNNVGPPL